MAALARIACDNRSTAQLLFPPCGAGQSHMSNQARTPPPPTWGRVGVGEASGDCLPPKRGFPLPDLPQVGAGQSHMVDKAPFLLPQHGGGSRWGKRAMTVSHRNAASPSLTSPRLGEGIFNARSAYAIALQVGGGDFSACSAYAIALPCAGRMRSLSARCNPLPRGGGGLGWGRQRFRLTRSSHERATPTPTLPQLGGGGREACSLKCDRGRTERAQFSRLPYATSPGSAA
jgi:hypothetical protein